jgi:aminobenzoyl-glutamate transport protein
MLASVLFIMFLCYWITEHIVEPKWGKYENDVDTEQKQGLDKLTEQESKALRWTGMAAMIFVVIVILLVAPDGALLRNPKNNSIIGSPFLDGIVPIILAFFLTVSITYGIKVGKIKEQKDIPRMMSAAMKELTGFIVMSFAAAQFIAFFGWSNIGQYVAVAGAHYLTAIQLTGYPLLFAFMMLTAVLSFCITSSSGLWVLLAPVFVPMFSMLGYQPAFIQLLYRVPDSAIHPVSPVEPFLPLFLIILSQYKKDVGLGTYFSLMLPYTLIILVFWIAFLSLWYFLNLPIGPGIPIRL